MSQVENWLFYLFGPQCCIEHGFWGFFGKEIHKWGRFRLAFLFLSIDWALTRWETWFQKQERQSMLQGGRLLWSRASSASVLIKKACWRQSIQFITYRYVWRIFEAVPFDISSPTMRLLQSGLLPSLELCITQRLHLQMTKLRLKHSCKCKCPQSSSLTLQPSTGISGETWL